MDGGASQEDVAGGARQHPDEHLSCGNEGAEEDEDSAPPWRQEFAPRPFLDSDPRVFG